MVRTRAVRRLEIGAGDASGLRGLKQVNVTAIDKRKAPLKRAADSVKHLRNARLVYGKEGEAIRFLKNAIKAGEKWNLVNAEHFFNDIGKERGKFSDALTDRKIVEIINLVKSVLSPRGVMRIEIAKGHVSRLVYFLEKNNWFVVSAAEVPIERIRSFWGREHLKRSREEDYLGYRPNEIIARPRKNNDPTEGFFERTTLKERRRVQFGDVDYYDGRPYWVDMPNRQFGSIKEPKARAYGIGPNDTLFLDRRRYSTTPRLKKKKK